MKGQQPTKVMKLMRLTLQVCPKSAMIIISRTFSTKQNQDFIISIRNFCLFSKYSKQIDGTETEMVSRSNKEEWVNSHVYIRNVIY